jgi:hypothetical protein
MNTLNYKRKNNIYNTLLYKHMWLGADTSGSNLGLGADASGPERHVAVELP